MKGSPMDQTLQSDYRLPFSPYTPSGSPSYPHDFATSLQPMPVSLSSLCFLPLLPPIYTPTCLWGSSSWVLSVKHLKLNPKQLCIPPEPDLPCIYHLDVLQTLLAHSPHTATGRLEVRENACDPFGIVGKTLHIRIFLLQKRVFVVVGWFYFVVVAALFCFFRSWLKNKVSPDQNHTYWFLCVTCWHLPPSIAPSWIYIPWAQTYPDSLWKNLQLF